MPITTAPTAPSRADPATFPDRADAFVAWQETSLVPQINALEANVNARESSTVAASNAAAAVVNATLWVSGTSYTLGQAVFDPVNFLTYRRSIAGAGTTRPGLDATNWVQVAGTGNVSTTGDQTIGGVKTFSSPVTAQSGRYTTNNPSLAMYEMHLPGIFASAWRLQANGTTDLVRTIGDGVPLSTLLSVTAAGILRAPSHLHLPSDTAGGVFFTEPGNWAAGINRVGTAVQVFAGDAVRQVWEATGQERSAIVGQSGVFPSFACRAWVNFNGTGTVAIRASGNVSSITDNGVGLYTVNFTTALPDANYAVVVTGLLSADGEAYALGVGGAVTTSSADVRLSRAGTPATLADSATVNVAIFR